mgnify:CR=1 FL=1
MTKKEKNAIAYALYQARTITVKPLTVKQRVHDLSIRTAALRISYALTDLDASFNPQDFLKSCGVS